MTDYEVDEHVDDVSNYNLSHNNDDSESDGEVPVHHQANDSDSDEELSFHHQPNHVHDGYPVSYTHLTLPTTAEV